MAVAGRVAIVPKGEWNAQTAYKRLDAVTHNNTLYFAKKDVSAGTATTNTEYWSKSISGSVVNVATDTEDGLMPKEDKKKLDGIDGDVAAKLGESKDGSLTYNGTEIKPSVETGQGLSIGEDGKLQVNIDGTTLTMDQVNNVIKLADTLKDAIDGAFPAANVANNQITTAEGFALDARQANPNIDGSLAKQISDLNGRLNIKFENLNPNGITKNFYYRKNFGDTGGWIRFFKLSYFDAYSSLGVEYDNCNVTISQYYNNDQGGVCNLDIIKDYPDKCYIIQRYNTLRVIKKFRVVRKDQDVYFDFYSTGVANLVTVIINIPRMVLLQDASIVDYLAVPEVSDGEKIIKSIDLAQMQ